MSHLALNKQTVNTIALPSCDGQLQFVNVRIWSQVVQADHAYIITSMRRYCDHPHLFVGLFLRYTTILT